MSKFFSTNGKAITYITQYTCKKCCLVTHCYVNILGFEWVMMIVCNTQRPQDNEHCVTQSAHVSVCPWLLRSKCYRTNYHKLSDICAVHVLSLGQLWGLALNCWVRISLLNRQLDLGLIGHTPINPSFLNWYWTEHVLHWDENRIKKDRL